MNGLPGVPTVTGATGATGALGANGVTGALGAPPALQVQGLHFAFDGEPPLFSALGFTLGAGVHRLSGESGSGKTTLLQLLAGQRPFDGQCRLSGLSPATDAAAWAQAVCFVDARQPAFDPLTPAALMASVRLIHPQLDEAAWRAHVDGFGLAPHAFKTMHMMSTGMRRKAALAAVLAAGAALALLDEPLAGLDAPAIAHLVHSLNALRGTTLVISGVWPAGLALAGQVVLGEV